MGIRKKLDLVFRIGIDGDALGRVNARVSYRLLDLGHIDFVHVTVRGWLR
jgi:hypothetical protein